MRRRIVILCMLALVGCASHREPAAGAAELRASAGATILAIDDKRVPGSEVVNQGEQATRAEAGSRKISVYTSSGHGAGEWTVPLTLEAGHVYRFSPASTTALSLRVVDETSGRVIAGPPAAVNAAAPPTPPSARP